MRMLLAVLALAGGMSVSSTLPAAAEDKADPKLKEVLVERIQDLNLTDEQEAKIADIRKEYQPKVQEAAKELVGIVKEEVEEIGGVLTAEQKDRLKSLKDARVERREHCVAHAIANLKDLDLTDGEMVKIGEIRKEFRPRIEKALKELQGLLSDEQKKARLEALEAGKKRREVLAALALTGDQKEKAAAAFKEVGTVVREEMEKIRDVLTAEQKDRLKSLKDARVERREQCVAHAIANLKDLDLTDGEMVKIGEIRKEFRPRIEKALNELQGLLTDEQKKARLEALGAGKKRREVLAALALTGDQKEKAAAAFKEVGTLVREEMEKIRDVLTEEQKEKLADLKDERVERVRDRKAHMVATFKDLDLTADQKEKLTAIRTKYRPKVHEAGNKLRATVQEQLQAILAVVKG